MKNTRKTRAKKFRNEDLKKILKFLIMFNLFAIPFYFLIAFNIEFSFLRDLTTGLAYNGLMAMGIDASMSGDFIIVPVENGQWAGYIDWDCTGWKSMFLFFALIFATELAIKKKIIFMLFIPIIYLINIARIIFMFWYVNTYGLANFDLIHATIWSWGLLLMVMILWVLCITKLSGKHELMK